MIIFKNNFIKPNFLLAILLPSMLLSCGDESSSSTNIITSTETTNNSAEQNTSDETKNSPVKTEAEIYLEVANFGIDLGKNLVEKQKIKDSIRMANKEKMYAYQIGLPLHDVSEAIESYKRIESIPNIYIFKESKKSYYLVQYEAKSDLELADSLESFKSKLINVSHEGAKVINLSLFCSKKEIVKAGEKIKKRRDDTEAPCLICD